MHSNQKNIYISVLRICLAFSCVNCKTTVKLIRSRMTPKLQHNLVTSVWGPENIHSGADRNLAWPEFANPPAFVFCEYVNLLLLYQGMFTKNHPKLILQNIYSKSSWDLYWRETALEKRFWMLNIVFEGTFFASSQNSLNFQYQYTHDQLIANKLQTKNYS